MSEQTVTKPAFPKWLSTLLMFLAFISAGTAGGWLIGRAASGVDLGLNLSSQAISLPTLLGGGLIFLGVTLAAHEFGHLLGGWLMGFRFMLFVVGPLKIVRESEHIRLRLNKDLSLYGGVASAMPTDDRDLPRRMAVMIAGGPLTSLLLSLLSLGLAVWFNNAIPAASPWSTLTAFAFIFSLLNFAIFIATIIPGKTSGFDTDGAQLLDVLRGGHRAERRWLIVALSAASTDGVRPRAWSTSQIEGLLALRAGQQEDVLANYFGYYHCLDAGQIRRAGELLDLCVEQAGGSPETVRPMIFAEAAYFTARHRQNASTARQLLPSASGGMLEAQTRLRAEAAVLLAEGRFVESAEKARAGLAHVHKSWDKGGALAEQDWLAEILHRAEAQAVGI